MSDSDIEVISLSSSDSDCIIIECESEEEEMKVEQAVEVKTRKKAKLDVQEDAEKAEDSNIGKEIGVALVAFGVSFLFLGVILLFDKGLLAIGNILFLCGLAFVIGLERTFRFFFQRHKIKGSVAFFGGILVVLFGWPLIGMVVEIYGFVLLFSGFFPFAINFLRRVPVIGTFLNMPGISKYVDRLAGDTGRSNV